MTPKQRAEIIIYKFYECDSILDEMDGGGGIEEAKTYALICVDEIITSIEYREGMNPRFTGFEYWENVKQQIELFKPRNK